MNDARAAFVWALAAVAYWAAWFAASALRVPLLWYLPLEHRFAFGAQAPGLAMCLLGYDFHLRPKPPSSEEAAAAWRPYIETCIETFGPGRAMFESNFPPDKGQCSYQVIFNAFKRIATQYSEAEKTALFSKTASDFYRLGLS